MTCKPLNITTPIPKTTLASKPKMCSDKVAQKIRELGYPYNNNRQHVYIGPGENFFITNIDYAWNNLRVHATKDGVTSVQEWDFSSMDSWGFEQLLLKYVGELKKP